MMQEFVHEVCKLIENKIREIHTAMPGQIVSFDSANGLATVIPAMKFKKPDGTTVDYPQISGVPVVFPQGMGGDAVIAYPVRAGDSCLLIVAEQSIDYWMYDQETETDLPFDLTNCICVPGLFQKVNSVVAEACEKDAIIMAVKDSRVTICENSIDLDAKTVRVNGTQI